MAAHQLLLFPEDATAPTLRDVADAVRTAGPEAGLPDAVPRADYVRYQDVHVRSALSQTTGMHFRWTLNPYRGCTHGCEYCYARKYQRHLELGAGDDFSTLIFIKRNLPDVLRRELSRASWTREGVAVGTATDPYQPIEGHCRITRQCLEVLVAAHTPFSIVTKGPMVVRDVDVLAAASRQGDCRVFLSVPSVDEEAWSRLEPGTAPPLQRLRAARALRDAGIDARVLMMPLVPGITTSRLQIERTVAAIADADVPLAGVDVARLDPGVREHFFAFLAREYPALVPGYLRLYQSARAKSTYIRAVTGIVHDLAGWAKARTKTPA
jgi:DNA repair photolyase